MVDDLAQVLAARDPVTAAHSTRVTFLATRLAQWLGWSERRIAELRAAVPLHDVGKITISAKILHKRGPLDERELAEIRTHPEAGATLIGTENSTEDALPYVLHHHERWDGGGYPSGRAGTSIPPGARLLAVVDAYDAMISTRPYRRALPRRHALAEIERCAGTQFDPDIASAFLRACEAGAFDVPEAAAR